MPLPTTGPLSLSQVNTELGRPATATISLGEAAVRALAGEEQFTGLFRQAQADGDIDPDLDPAVLARRYQSDLLGLRLSAERSSLDASAIAAEFAESLGRLRPAN